MGIATLSAAAAVFTPLSGGAAPFVPSAAVAAPFVPSAVAAPFVPSAAAALKPTVASFTPGGHLPAPSGPFSPAPLEAPVFALAPVATNPFAPPFSTGFSSTFPVPFSSLPHVGLGPPLPTPPTTPPHPERRPAAAAAAACARLSAAHAILRALRSDRCPSTTASDLAQAEEDLDLARAGLAEALPLLSAWGDLARLEAACAAGTRAPSVEGCCRGLREDGRVCLGEAWRNGLCQCCDWESKKQHEEYKRVEAGFASEGVLGSRERVAAGWEAVWQREMVSWRFHGGPDFGHAMWLWRLRGRVMDVEAQLSPEGPCGRVE